jgi:hypothetical protein
MLDMNITTKLVTRSGFPEVKLVWQRPLNGIFYLFFGVFKGTIIEGN